MGIEELNHNLQALFNPATQGKAQLSRAKGRQWRVGDRVTHLKNDAQVTHSDTRTHTADS